jgi:hypothetical protein
MDVFTNGVRIMPISTPATISFPLDIPQVDVLTTKQTRDGKFIITVESRRETTQCGVCKKEIACTYGPWASSALAPFTHTGTRDLHYHSATSGTMSNLPTQTNHNPDPEMVRPTQPTHQSL